MPIVEMLLAKGLLVLLKTGGIKTLGMWFAKAAVAHGVGAAVTGAAGAVLVVGGIAMTESMINNSKAFTDAALQGNAKKAAYYFAQLALSVKSGYTGAEEAISAWVGDSDLTFSQQEVVRSIAKEYAKDAARQVAEKAIA